MTKKLKYFPFKKKFYRISRERLEAYLDLMHEASDLIKEVRPEVDSEKVNWQSVDKAWGKIINVLNSLYGFKNYEDALDGGEGFQDSYLYEEWVELDNGKFYQIEFKKD